MRVPITETSANRGPRAQLSEQERAIALQKLADGMSQRQVAAAMRCAKSTITRLKDHYQTTESLKPTPRTGRPHVITDREERQIARMARSRPDWTYKQVSDALMTNVSHRTIFRILKSLDIINRRGTKNPQMTREIGSTPHEQLQPRPVTATTIAGYDGLTPGLRVMFEKS